MVTISWQKQWYKLLHTLSETVIGELAQRQGRLDLFGAIEEPRLQR